MAERRSVATAPARSPLAAPAARALLAAPGQATAPREGMRFQSPLAAATPEAMALVEPAPGVTRLAAAAREAPGSVAMRPAAQ
ncbi:MAG: hypothetical protein KatS3mg059_0009 [Thermomicrobiales bacterium]|nr:MAG: hypothetical protein KatS3mg059_0009 [Thermomicrobiales bacterium]